jgi:hypothetical protein
MKLPNAETAYIPLPKLRDYLLSETHAIGRAKAAFFYKIGFTRERAEELQIALSDVARTGNVVDVVETLYGKKYVVDGELRAPMGASIKIRTVWIVEKGEVAPRFVTAYPRKGG